MRTKVIFTRLVNCCWSIFQWCLALVVAAVLALGGYIYLKLDDEIRSQVHQRLTNHYTGYEVQVGRTHFEPDHGIAIYNVVLLEAQPDGTKLPIITIDELYLSGKLRVEDLISDRLNLDQVIVRRGKVHAALRGDGTWNVKSLLPLPDFSENSPVVKVEDATVFFADVADDNTLQTVQGIDILLTPLKLPTSEDAKGRFHMTAVVRGLPAREAHAEGQFDGENGAFQLTATIAGFQVTADLVQAASQILATDLNGAAVTGRADVVVQASQAGQSQPFHWIADVAFDNGKLVHPRLPEPLTDLSFTGRAEPQRLHIDRLTCQYGPAGIAIALERAGWAKNSPLALATRFVGLPINDKLHAVMPEACNRAWERFQPKGIVDGDLKLTFDGLEWRSQLAIDCRNVSLTDAERFPYPLQQITGRIDFQPTAAGDDSLRINLAGSGAGRPVKIDADLVLRTDYPIGWLEITGESIPIHEQLLEALPAHAESLVRSLRPQGEIDFTFRAEWSHSSLGRAQVTQDIRLKDCSVLFEKFPYPLRNINGLLTERDDVWTLHDIEGRGWNDSTVVVCRGTSTPQGDECVIDVSLHATNVALDDNLKLALSPTGQQFWQEVQPQGRIDFWARAICEPGRDEPRIEAVLQPRERSVALEPLNFRYRLEQIEGLAEYRDGRVNLQNVVARHDSAVFSAASGAWQPTADGGWQMLLAGINVDRFTPQRDLLAALPTEWQRMVERVQPTGTFGIYNSSLTLTKSPNLPQLAAAWDVHLDFHRARLGGDLPLRSMTGGMRLTGRHDGQNAYTAGELSLDSLYLKDVQLTNVRGPMWIDSTVCLFGEAATGKSAQPPRRVTADAYGGSLAANVEINHESMLAYRAEIALGGASLARFANECLGGPRDMSGVVSGRLNLTGTGQSAQTIRGAGELSVVDANIYELPILVAMLKVLRNRTPDTTAFNRCDMQFDIRGDQIHFEKLNLLGDAVSLYGKGDSGFDRQLDLVFYTMPEPANLPIPLWKTIAGQVSQQALQLKVVGTWDHAEVQPQTFPGINQVLEQIQAGAATLAPTTASRDSNPFLR